MHTHAHACTHTHTHMHTHIRTHANMMILTYIHLLVTQVWHVSYPTQKPALDASLASESAAATYSMVSDSRGWLLNG
jgi:hypothetical protein